MPIARMPWPKACAPAVWKKTVQLLAHARAPKARGRRSSSAGWLPFVRETFRATHLVALERVGPSHTEESVQRQLGDGDGARSISRMRFRERPRPLPHHARRRHQRENAARSICLIRSGAGLSRLNDIGIARSAAMRSAHGQDPLGRDPRQPFRSGARVRLSDTYGSLDRRRRQQLGCVRPGRGCVAAQGQNARLPTCSTATANANFCN